MIETVADANQRFSTRAKTKGVYEIAPSESTMLAKSLDDIVAMLKEIKEGQQVTPVLLKGQPDHSQQNSINYCHYPDECPQLQEDNLGGKMNSKTSGVRLNRTNQDSPIISRGTTRTPDISPLTTVNNTLQQTTNR
ncbi:hypothetical protein PIB30_007607 [Stylosanthes scabra]|uniref:Uncharacterized protein n=1 Tax=Stylosanthes scabra TaxID=79078 RepID=A0ABU6U504_9FABA|nr:hypothetical protein [Stylosanthes scabra]